LVIFCRVYAGWEFNQGFYREKLYESALGYNGLEDFMKSFWETWALSKGMNNSKSAEREINAI
jgi:homoserine O-acetyltransferase